MTNKRLFFIAVLMFVLACNLPIGSADSEPPPAPVLSPSVEPSAVAPSVPLTTETPAFTPLPPAPTLTPTAVHVKIPALSVPAGGIIYDVESLSTAPEKRAPYGDSYNINRMERPFLRDMSYVPDLDIANFSLTQDADFFYVSIDLIGDNPNNALGIHYGVEIDQNHDGFGDYLIWASPPYSAAWDTVNVKIFADSNRDTGGRSANKSDAPFSGDGYDKLVFNGGIGDADPDLAWVRINASGLATVQFAFKSSWSGSVFMLGVLTDAGLRNPAQMDYVDRFTEEQAGSPVKDKKYYPLKELYAVDNSCWEAFGFKPNGYESKLCPRTPATPEPKGGKTPGNCSQYGDQASCQAAGCNWVMGGMMMVYYYCAP